MKKLPPSGIVRREVHPALQWLRDRFLGRHVETGLRFEEDMSDRTQPPPSLPEGPSHRLFGNYYFARDPRRLISAPLLITGPGKIKELPSSERSKESYLTKYELGTTPGQLYDPPIESEAPHRDPVYPEDVKDSKK